MHKLIVDVVEAKNVPSKDGLLGKSDPFCVLQLPIGGKTKAHQTKHINNNNNPVWNQQFTFEGVDKNETLRVVVFDYDLIGKNQELGQATVPLGSLNPGHTSDMWIQLINANNKGEVHLKITLQA